MRVGVLGAAGAVGRELWRLLESSPLPTTGIVAYGTARSHGRMLTFRDRSVACRELTERSLEPVDLVLASAGAETARVWAPRFVAAGAAVVDNSSAFRRDPAVPLIVPEINGDRLDGSASLVANPNCSTIQMVVALAPLHRAYGLCGVRVATYQSVSGAGMRAMEELDRQTRDALAGAPSPPETLPAPIAFSLIPYIGDVDETGESLEERKMRDETRRILDLPDLAVSAHCVRVPVRRGHSEAVWARFDRAPDPREAARLLAEAGLVVTDSPGEATPLLAAYRPEVFVGRIRRDPVDERGLILWIVSDNLLKGAALNAVQIAELLHARGRFSRRAP